MRRPPPFRRLWRLCRDESGSFAILFALLLVPIMGALGVALDVGLAYYMRSRLEHSLDATALVVGGSVGDDAGLFRRGDAFFTANYPAEKFGTPENFALSSSGDVIRVSADARMDTLFLPLIGVNEIIVSAEAEVVRSIRGLGVALVLDNTGSMNSNNNIGALREASRDLVDILFGSETVHPRLFVGLVPYSASVNPGDEAETLVAGGGTVDHTPVLDWKGCVIERPAPHTFADTSPLAQPWTPYVWAPAVDNAYDPTDPSTVRYGAAFGNGGTGPNLGCPTPIRALTNDKATLIDDIDRMEAWSRGGTFSDIGMAWGLRVLSPEPPFTQGRAWGTPKWDKAVILMTDGNNQFYRLPGWAGPNQRNDAVRSDFSGYGRLDEFGLLGTTNLGTANDVVNANLSQICQALKDRGIIVYTVTFTPNLDNETRDVYRTCATDVTKYFDSPSQDDPRASFRAIATELSMLRISR